MPISPWTAGKLAPAWTISLVPDQTNGPNVVSVAGLVAANFSLLIRNIGTGSGSGSESAGAGTFSAITAAVTSIVSGTLVIASHASVLYQPASADVIEGRYRLTCNVTFGNGTAAYDLGVWEVVAL